MSAFNGSGTFVISGSGLPFVANTTISSTVVNTLDSDLATGLTNCICKDGQSTPTANIGFGGFKITNMANGSADTDAIAFGQVSPATGTFTPVDASSGALSLTSPVGYYRKYVGFVEAWGSFTYPVTVDASNTLIGGLPLTSANLTTQQGGFTGSVTFGGGSGDPGGNKINTVCVLQNTKTFIFRAGGGAAITNVQASGYHVDFFVCYPI